MIALAGTIISSTLIFVIFRLFEKYKIDTFQAIVFNYFTAFICGVVLYSPRIIIGSLEGSELASIHITGLHIIHIIIFCYG